MGILKRLLGRKDTDPFDLDKPYEPMSSELQMPGLDQNFGTQQRANRVPQADDMPMGSVSSSASEQDMQDSGVSPMRSYSPHKPVHQPQAAPRPLSQNRDIELILSKLDTIRSTLSNIEIRLSHLERAAGIRENDKGYRW